LLTLLYVRSLTRTTEFYDAVFGWPKSVAVPTYTEYEVEANAFLGFMEQSRTETFLGDAVRGLAQPELQNAEVYLRVEDVHEVERRLLEQGATCLSALAPRSWGESVAYFRDPDGFVLAIAPR